MSEAAQVFRISGAGRLGAAIMAVVILVFTASVAAGAIQLLAASEFMWAVLVAALTVIPLTLARYIWRDLTAKFGWRVEVAPGGAIVSLPAGRSLYHRLSHFSGEVEFSELSHVECRPEVYSHFGTESVIETWWLVPRQGEPLFVAEDRPTNPEYDIRTTFAREAATAIADAAGVKIRRRRPADGHAGILGVWGVRPPDW